MARQAKKENTENMDVTDQPDVETTVAENNAENIVPDAGNAGVAEQNANTEEGTNGDGGTASNDVEHAGFCQLADFNVPTEIPEGEAYEIEVTYQPQLESLAVLADRHRVPGWQQAALMRMMGWDDGKMVTDAEYRMALDKLRSRRLGGGRLA